MPPGAQHKGHFAWRLATLAARGSGAARKMPASCEGLINLLSPEVTAWWGAGVSIFWHNYLGSEGRGLRRRVAALCVL